jgi:DNA-binding Lrp family transcriptional regulator
VGWIILLRGTAAAVPAIKMLGYGQGDIGHLCREGAVASEKEGSAMATRAFILIETAVGKTKEVVAALQKLEGVVSADPVTGPYDIVAIAEALELNAIGDLVTSKIHPIAGITRTVTCLSVGLS